ncbi:MAG: TraB/GumN family protein [Calditrichia bacterium]
MRFLKSLLFSAALLGLGAGCSAPKSLLWEISHEKLEQPSYLFGTVHMIGESKFILKENAEAALAASDQLVLELNPQSPAVQQAAMASMLLTDDKTLQSLLGDDFSSVAKVFSDSFSIDLNQMNRIKPFFVVMSVLPKLVGEPVKSYEMVFLERANKRGIDVLELETAAQQFAALEELTQEKYAELMTEFAMDLNDQRRQFANLVRLYLAGDLNGLRKASIEEEDMAEFNEAILVKRNRNWIPLIENFIAEESSFIAVGAGHLPGKTGVIKLLQKAGYSVKPLPSSR